MNRDIILSGALHLILVAATIVSSPFDLKKHDLGEVIKVNLSAMPEMRTQSEPVSIENPTPPPAIEDVIEEIPITDPTTKPAAKITKPEPKPKKDPPKEKPKQPTPSKETTTETSSSENGKEVDVDGGSSSSPFGGVTIDNESFDYPYWFTQAFRKIQSNWRNTVVADGKLVCTIYFQVIKSGRMIKAEVKESSGIEKFDLVCLSAIQRSAPFPSLPQEFSDEIIGITVPFVYNPAMR